MKKLWVIPLVAVLVVLVDAACKHWALTNLQAGVLRPFIPGVLQLTLTTNPGGAFGIFKQFKILMTILPIVICLAICLWITKRTRSADPLTAWEQAGYGLVLGGAVGNIIERIFRGQVTDFLDFAFMDFPIFNVADALIDVGVAIILLRSFFAAPPAVEQNDSVSEPAHE